MMKPTCNYKLLYMETGTTNQKDRWKMKFLTCLGLFSLIHFTASAANETAAKAPASSVLSNPLFIILLTIIIFLAILIKAFAGVVDAAADRKIKKEKAATGPTAATKAKVFHESKPGRKTAAAITGKRKEHPRAHAARPKWCTYAKRLVKPHYLQPLKGSFDSLCLSCSV